MEPAVLASALAGVLAEAGDDVDVVDVCDPGSRPSAHYDAAVITARHAEVHADLVIELPDSGGGPGMGTVTSSSGSERVAMQGLDDLLRLLRS